MTLLARLRCWRRGHSWRINDVFGRFRRCDRCQAEQFRSEIRGRWGRVPRGKA